MKNKEKLITYFLATLIVALAFIVRFYNIEHAPSGIYPDEAVNGIDAIRSNKSGHYSWFYPDNNGREGLFMNLVAFSFKLFEVSILGLKFPAIVCGTLTVWGIFLLSKQLFRSNRFALIASFLTAFSFWSINFSRISFRANMLPMILTFTFYFLFRGIRTKKYAHFAISGFIFGIGLHTYIAYRISPAILAILFVALWVIKKDFIKDYWKQSLAFIALMLVSMTPMLLTFKAHPEYLSSRTASISIFSPEVNQGHLFLTAIKSFVLSMAKYNFWGDQNWRHNYPPYPVINPLVGITFLTGLIYVITKFFHLVYLRFKHGIRDRKLYIYSFILAWFFVMQAPEFLSAEGLPHALRAIGALPVVFIIATIPIVWLLGKADEMGHGPRVATQSLIIFAIIFAGAFDAVKYHVFWANNPRQANSFESNLIDASNYINTLPQNSHIIVIAENMQRIPIKMLHFDDSRVTFIHPGELDGFLQQEIQPGTFFILTDKQPWISDKISATNKNSKLEKINGKFGESFWVLSPQ